MAPLFLSYSLVTLIFMTMMIWFQRKRRRFQNIPPCPPTIPIMGNLHYLKPDVPQHRVFHAISKTHGPIFSFWFASRLAVVVSSPSLAQECLSKYDTVLANRPPLLSGKHLFYNFDSCVYSPYGTRWRNLRRIANTDVLSPQRLNAFYEARKEEAMRMIGKLVKVMEEEGLGLVRLRPRLQEMSFNSIMRMVCGKMYDCEEDEQVREFKEILSEILSLMGAQRSDFLPWVRWLDLDGVVKRMKRISGSADSFLRRLLHDQRTAHDTNNQDNMIRHLFSLHKTQPQDYSDQVIKALIQDLLLAGTDTTAMALEWALSALLNHPKILEKAKDEVDTLVGKDRLVDESDIANLRYIQCIIYETLRLYTPGPLLLPHYSSEDCNIGGFIIPRDTIVVINAWTAQRDPQVWSDAECFKPERFEMKGEANKLIAFGLGRRACPGSGLAYRTMSLTLALLIQCFEWKRLTDEEIDMREEGAITTPKLIPLEAMCKARPITKKIK